MEGVDWLTGERVSCNDVMRDHDVRAVCPSPALSQKRAA